MKDFGRYSPGAALLVASIALVWAGFIVGGAFVAVPAKFEAAHLTMSVALEVGRAQFEWIGAAESALCFAFAVALVNCGGVRWPIALLSMLVFFLQRVYLLPVLDERALRIIAGEAVPSSDLHFIFIGLEVVKLAGLVVFAWLLISAQAKGPTEQQP
ncbi:MAG: hypothetical protein CMN57_11610 [Gammaproteobacteria bacterium]|nr:hypothetical protein [Gammaproteobacteria bacterium]|tara:strand:- start:349 stop:819 length:471 start_codon:yes stop_codon:yes gene_type:complete